MFYSSSQSIVEIYLNELSITNQMSAQIRHQMVQRQLLLKMKRSRTRENGEKEGPRKIDSQKMPTVKKVWYHGLLIIVFCTCITISLQTDVFWNTCIKFFLLVLSDFVTEPAGCFSMLLCFMHFGQSSEYPREWTMIVI